MARRRGRGVCWLVDLYACSPLVGLLYLHAMWHLCIGYFAMRLLPLFDADVVNE